FALEVHALAMRFTILAAIVIRHRAAAVKEVRLAGMINREMTFAMAEGENGQSLLDRDGIIEDVDNCGLGRLGRAGRSGRAQLALLRDKRAWGSSGRAPGP